MLTFQMVINIFI
ncbi:hypothetical protein b4604 [Escherichia coli K-12]|nr:hypothetical protein b4604 [Escherichia coli K-12]